MPKGKPSGARTYPRAAKPRKAKSIKPLEDKVKRMKMRLRSVEDRLASAEVLIKILIQEMRELVGVSDGAAAPPMDGVSTFDARVAKFHIHDETE